MVHNISIIAILLISVFTSSVHAKGLLDPEFGLGGKVTLPAGVESALEPYFVPSGLIAEADNSILVSASSTVPSVAGSNKSAVIVRKLLPTGKLASGFGTNGGGSLIVAIDAYNSTAGAIKIPSGYLVLVRHGDGTLWTHSWLFLTASGLPDPAFGAGTGIVHAGMGDQYVKALIILDGFIHVLAQTAGVGGPPWSVYRFLSEGNPDLTYSQSGRWIFYDGNGVLIDAQLDPEGRIVALGSDVVAGDYIPLLLRLVPQHKKLDPEFGQGGTQQLYYRPVRGKTIPVSYSSLSAGLDGKYRVVGASTNASIKTIFCVLDSQGEPDISVSANGCTERSFGVEGSYFQNVVTNKSNQSVALGYLIGEKKYFATALDAVGNVLGDYGVLGISAFDGGRTEGGMLKAILSPADGSVFGLSKDLSLQYQFNVIKTKPVSP